MTTNSSSDAKVDLKPGIYVGADISVVLLLLPYVKTIFVPFVFAVHPFCVMGRFTGLAVVDLVLVRRH